MSEVVRGLVVDSEPVGWQMDRNGGIWDYYHVPYLERHDLGASIEYKVIFHWVPIQITNTQCVTRVWARTVKVSKFTGRIELVYQQEEIDTVRPIAPRRLRQESSVRWFDAVGRPNSYMNATAGGNYASDQFIVQPFIPVNYYYGKDMRASFRSFLISHGMADLVPEDMR